MRKLQDIMMTTIAMMIICWSCTGYAEMSGPFTEEQLHDWIKKKDEVKQADKSRHDRINGLLTHLEDIFNKSGIEKAKEFASKHFLKINDQNNVRVVIELKSDFSLSLNKETFEAYGIVVIHTSRIANIIDADIPLGRIREIADNVNGISYINVPKRLRKASYKSEGVGLVGASSYISSGIIGSGIKIAVIDQGFAGISAAISKGDIPATAILSVFCNRCSRDFDGLPI